MKLISEVGAAPGLTGKIYKNPDYNEYKIVVTADKMDSTYYAESHECASQVLNTMLNLKG